jgi:hypothetical protein
MERSVLWAHLTEINMWFNINALKQPSGKYAYHKLYN